MSDDPNRKRAPAYQVDDGHGRRWKVETVVGDRLYVTFGSYGESSEVVEKRHADYLERWNV